MEIKSLSLETQWEFNSSSLEMYQGFELLLRESG